MRQTVTLVVLSCGLCWGQAANDCKPSTLNIPSAQYPCVYSDNRVTFHLAAPDAQKVQVRLGRAYDMTRGADGVWSVTIPPQVVGFHYYTLISELLTYPHRNLAGSLTWHSPRRRIACEDPYLENGFPLC